MPNPIKHNHPPVSGIVPNCEYCKMNGNVFINGPIQLDSYKLSAYMKCFPNIK